MSAIISPLFSTVLVVSLPSPAITRPPTPQHVARPLGLYVHPFVANLCSDTCCTSTPSGPSFRWPKDSDTLMYSDVF
ncbi:hypothetical protein BXZ70DRAFT_922736 [Cristinia sonorae]|uniref:Secreted protein n=1 Tax=Cristinia sonorae TaxID=1940300 RepID=A0A8K0XT80_9AGAR|nr:hypothetical protein BXZ70DRAFT_922736 [Cristinia sonorae]